MKEDAVTALSKLSVRHGDLDVRNITYDDRTAPLMLIDFDRSSFVGRKVLSALSSNKRRANGSTESCSKMNKVFQ